MAALKIKKVYVKRSGLINTEGVCWGNKEFKSHDDFGFDDAIQILDDWQEGHVDAEDVNYFAEGLVELGENSDWPVYPEDEPKFALFVVMVFLENLFGEKIFKEDIPQLKTALELGETHPKEAVDALDVYLNSIDYDERERFVAERLAKGLGWPL